MWRVMVAVPDPNSFIAFVFIKSRDWHRYTSHFKMVAHRKFSDQNKSLGVNCIQRIIKFELLMWTQVEENSYSRLILLDSRGFLSNSFVAFNCNNGFFLSFQFSEWTKRIAVEDAVKDVIVLFDYKDYTSKRYISAKYAFLWLRTDLFHITDSPL